MNHPKRNKSLVINQMKDKMGKSKGKQILTKRSHFTNKDTRFQKIVSTV